MQASPVHTSTQQEDKQAGEHQVSNIGVDCSSNARPAEIRPCTTVACRVCVVVMQEAGTLNRTGQQLSPPWMVSTYAGCTAQPEDADPVEGHEHPVEPQRTAWCRSPSRATHACASMDHPPHTPYHVWTLPKPGQAVSPRPGACVQQGTPCPQSLTGVCLRWCSFWSLLAVGTSFANVPPPLDRCRFVQQRTRRCGPSAATTSTCPASTRGWRGRPPAPTASRP